MVGMLQALMGNSTQRLVQLAGTFVSASGGTIGGATANYDVVNDGNEKGDFGGIYATIGPWLLVGAVGDYEVRFTHVSGDPPTGTFGSWLVLSTTRGVSLSAGIGEIDTAQVLVEIRQAGVGSALASTTVTIESERF